MNTVARGLNTVAARRAAKIATPKTTFPSGRNAVEVNAVKAAVAARLAAVVVGDITVLVRVIQVVRLATLFCTSACTVPCVTATTALRKAPYFVEFPYVCHEPDLVNERLP